MNNGRRLDLRAGRSQRFGRRQAAVPRARLEARLGPPSFTRQQARAVRRRRVPASAARCRQPARSTLPRRGPTGSPRPRASRLEVGGPRGTPGGAEFHSAASPGSATQAGAGERCPLPPAGAQYPTAAWADWKSAAPGEPPGSRRPRVGRLKSACLSRRWRHIRSGPCGRHRRWAGRAARRRWRRHRSRAARRAPAPGPGAGRGYQAAGPGPAR